MTSMSAAADSIMFSVENMRNGEGRVAYALCREDEFNLAYRGGASCDIQGAIEAQPDVTQFGVNVPGGTYAIIMVHDENRDQRLSPDEGLGLSNNPDLDREDLTFSDVALKIEGRMGTEIRLEY